MLTQEQKQLILAAIEAGATDHVAAEAAGMSARKFRELRQRAEGRHPKRPPTPELIEFFEQVDQAIARARMKREIEVAERDAKYWLANRARSRPGLDGWSEPIPEPPDPTEQPSPMSVEELRQVTTTLVVSGAVVLEPCADPGCTCAYHRTTRLEGVGP